MGDWRLTFVGTGSLLSASHRGFPATLLDASVMRVLFDCGDGTLGRLRSLGSPTIGAVAVTSNSVAELAGLLTLAEVHRRTRGKALRVFGPTGLKEELANLSTLSESSTGELFDIEEVTTGHVLLKKGGTHLEGVEVDVGQGSSGCAYLVYESPLPGRIDMAKAATLGIEGGDFTLLQEGHNVRGVRPDDVIGPLRPGRRVVVAGRGRSTEALEAALEGADAAVFAAPFMDERLEMAEDSHYFTGWEAAELASRARVRHVVLQRLGSHAPLKHHVAEARQFHKQLVAPEDGDALRIPLLDTGIPVVLERNWNPRPGAVPRWETARK